MLKLRSAVHWWLLCFLCPHVLLLQVLPEGQPTRCAFSNMACHHLALTGSCCIHAVLKPKPTPRPYRMPTPRPTRMTSVPHAQPVTASKPTRRPVNRPHPKPLPNADSEPDPYSQPERRPYP